MDSQLQRLTKRIQSGDQKALGPVFQKYRKQLKSAIRLRFHDDVRAREDESDILQESYFAAAQDLARYANHPSVPVYVWLRGIVQQRLVAAHRKHLLCQQRTVKREVSPHARFPNPDLSTIASHFVADHSSPSMIASRLELQAIVEKAMQKLEPIDREIIALRHIEGMRSCDVAAFLGIKKTTASTRYLRALKKLKDALFIP